MSALPMDERASAAHPRELSIQDYTYTLPDDRIARHPLHERDASRLLVYRAGAIEDRTFRELPDLVPPNALLILNDTRVVRARIQFRRATGALLECMVMDPEGHRPMEQALMDRNSSRWWCMMGNSKRWKGEELHRVHDGFSISARRIEQREGEHLIEFRWNDGSSFVEALRNIGTIPLPPYMRRDAMPDDTLRYNTVFAQNDGSIAAPTASLHFSARVLEQLAERGVRSARLTLHVGAGTFLPVKSERMAEHRMHTEQVRISRAALVALREQVGRGPIIPVGTTALRTLESIYWHGVQLLQGNRGAPFHVDQWAPYNAKGQELPDVKAVLDTLISTMEESAGVLSGTTSLLIAPGYTFRFADGLVTNFHQPQSTLLLLVAAFVGSGWRTVYEHALAQDYRFLSYGDSSLLFKHPS